MCRLYGMRSTHPGPLECELIEAQNALVRQSRRDSRGLSNVDGWGIAHIDDGEVHRVRQTGPAFESEAFRKEAGEANTSAVLAHVRRATVGEARVENAHPFRRDDQLFAHNGHIGAFEQLRPRMLDEMPPEHRDAIEGDTDSEHFFHLLLARAGDDRARIDVLEDTIDILRRWIDELDPDVRDGFGSASPSPDALALNVLWLGPEELVGSRLGRSLWYVERDEPHVCEMHGRPHVSVPPGEDYRAVVVASDRITDEPWEPVPESCVFTVSDEIRLEVREL